MKIKDITEKIDKIVPLKLAQDWDNVGLLIGDPQRNVKNMLLTIDITNDVLAEAKRSRTDLIISYHPVIWDGLKKIKGDDIVFDLIQAGIAVFSIHTALDAVVGGVNDGLAEIVGIVDGKPIGDYVESPPGNNYKLVVFVPAESAAKVSNAIFAAGAGAIGNYGNCGFTAEGTGTFLPLAGAKPAIGKKWKLEKIPEIRFETIAPAGKLASCIAAMKKAHPYEEPAFDIFKIYNNQNKFGLGRIGKLQKPTQLNKILERIKKHTGAKAFGIVGNQNRLIRTAAVCAGSRGKNLNSIIRAKA